MAIAAVGAFVLATPTPRAAIRYVVAAHSVEPGSSAHHRRPDDRPG